MECFKLRVRSVSWQLVHTAVQSDKVRRQHSDFYLTVGNTPLPSAIPSRHAQVKQLPIPMEKPKMSQKLVFCCVDGVFVRQQLPVGGQKGLVTSWGEIVTSWGEREREGIL